MLTITVILKAAMGILRQFASAKKVILKLVDRPTKKTELWNPVGSRVFYT